MVSPENAMESIVLFLKKKNKKHCLANTEKTQVAEQKYNLSYCLPGYM